MKPITKTRLSHLINLPKIKDEGYLSFVEGENHIPFEIKRVYYIYDTVKNAVRGRHAHKKTKQALFCIRGSVTIVLDNGLEREEITLSNPNMGIYLDAMMWHDMIDFSKDAVLMVLASSEYDEGDYIREYTEFLIAAKSSREAVPPTVIMMNDFQKEYNHHKKEVKKAINTTLEKGWYILGDKNIEFEKKFAAYIGTKYAIGVANGLEALQIALMAIGVRPGDQVITVANTAVATALAITNIGATPVFVDIDAYHHIDPLEIERAITSKTKAILPVHLFGQVANMKAIREIAKKYSLQIVEDACQAHGAQHYNKKAGALGDIGCFSFYPTKNLGTYGDGGAITTNSYSLYEKCLRLRNYGQTSKYVHTERGLNSRLDEIHAAILSVKLDKLNSLITKRRKIANLYSRLLQDILHISLPKVRKGSKHAYHLFVIEAQDRDGLQQYLRSKNIESHIHYPTAIHKQKAFEEFKMLKLPKTEEKVKQILSLPIHPFLTTHEVQNVCDAIKEFYMVSTKKKSVTIGIPAHNEERNIAQLLQSILSQKGSSFAIDQIIVNCDGCTDKTSHIVNQIAQIHPIISCLDDGDHLGQPTRLNQLYRLSTSDIFITFDADTKLGNAYVVENLVNKFTSVRVGLVAGTIKTFAQKSIIGKALNTYESFWSTLTNSINSGDSVHQMIGPISAASRAFINQVVIPKDLVASDHFLYFKSKELKYQFKVASDAYVYIKAPSTYQDFVKQTSRFHNSLTGIHEYFGNWVNEYYKIPFRNKLIAYALTGIKSPIYLSIALMLQLFQRIANYQLVGKKTSGVWSQVSSSK